MNTKIKTGKDSKVLRTRKSVALTPAQLKAFEKWVAKQPTKIDAAEKLKVSRGALDDLLNRGTGKPKNIARIKRLSKRAA